MHNIADLFYFGNNTLHVSDGLSVRHQESKTVHTALCIRGLLEKYPTFGREKETGLLGALDT